MGRGSYHGGSSLLSFSWFGWGSRPTEKKTEKKGKPSKAVKELIEHRKSEKSRKHVARQAEEMRLAKIRREEKKAAAKRNLSAKPSQPLQKVRAGHGDPEMIAKRLNRHMLRVDVRRITSHTLRLRKRLPD